ncbi:Gp49 family protein [Burkholderia anthina]|uniref:Gp49 family protein n=1 Tax=Burkholderia anthina TaxID=179879 RepID=UPI001FC83E0E|nr:Gp49 family protein [Burkholderia anthina]
MIEPTVGRIVHFRPGKQAANLRIQCDARQPIAAIVTYVHDPRRVNLALFDALGRNHAFTNVRLLQDDDKGADDEPFAEWMPFQKGQAAKTEAAEKQLGVQRSPGNRLVSEAEIDAESVAKGKTAPRITPADIEASIASEHFFTAADPFIRDGSYPEGLPESLELLTFCVLILRNGFTVTGESACASPENFDAEIGRKIARANAVQKIWPLEGYLLKQRLHDAA